MLTQTAIRNGFFKQPVTQPRAPRQLRRPIRPIRSLRPKLCRLPD